MNDKYKKILFELANKAYKKNEVPVSAIIVCDDKIIAKAINKRHSTKNPLDHAEIIAIKKASKKIKDWRLSNCEMYVTLEPCNMCKEIINASRIKKVIYFSKSNSKINSINTIYKQEKTNNKEFDNILVKFFKEKR